MAATTDVVFGEVKRDFDINPYSYAMNSSRTLDPDEFYTRNYAPFNILDELGKNYIDLNVVDTKFQAELRYKPVTGLELSALAAIKYSATTQEHNITDYSNQARAYRAMATTVIRDNNPFLYTDPDNAYAVPISILPKGGIYKRRDNNMLSYDFRFAASYNTEINNQHIINLYGGMEVNQSDRHESWFNGWGMQYSMGLIPFYAHEVFKKGKEENTDYFGLADTHYATSLSSSTAPIRGTAATPSTEPSVTKERTAWVRAAAPAGCRHGTSPVHGTYTKRISSRRCVPHCRTCR